MTEKVSQNANKKAKVNHEKTIHEKLNDMHEPRTQHDDKNTIDAEITFKKVAHAAIDLIKTAPFLFVIIVQAITILGLVYLLIK